MVNSPLLEFQSITRSFISPLPEDPKHRIQVLCSASFSLANGETCSIVGPSGSGKTTLLSIASGLESPESGTVIFDGQNLFELSEQERTLLRRQRMGFVFQNFRLVASLTALENVMLPLELLRRHGAKRSAEEGLARVGLGARLHHLPHQLSGGEQQRVALARAFIHRPMLLFADEPTGNLDAETSERITELLFSLNREFNTTLLLVTHNQELAQRTGRIISLRAGRIESDERL